MKKLSCLFLALLLLLTQLLCIPVFATETDPEATETEPPVEEYVDTAVPVVPFGMASITNGCRTMEAQVPLGGSDRMLDSAQAAFVYELNTGTLLYAYNPDNVMSPGALTKMLTAIVALENSALDEEVTVSTASHSTLPAGARNSKLKHGEILTMEDLLYCLIVDMSNDAALAIAEHISGSESEFVKLMNEKAAALSCTNTVFTNCHGIDAAGQTSTARDLARIVQYCIKNDKFVDIFGTTEYEIAPTNKTEEKRELETLNYLMQQLNVTKYIDDRVTGGVATYTTSSGASLACTAQNEAGLSLIIVVLGCERVFNTERGTVESYGNFEEVWDLLAFGFENYKVCRLFHNGQSMSQFSVANGENQVVGQTTTDMDAVLPIKAKLDTLNLRYSVVGGGLKAPIAAGQKISTLQIWYRTSCIAEAEIFSMSSVRSVDDSRLEVQSATRDDSNLKDILGFLGIVCLIILVPLIIYVIVNRIRYAIIRNRRRRRRRSRRRSR